MLDGPQVVERGVDQKLHLRIVSLELERVDGFVAQLDMLAFFDLLGELARFFVDLGLECKIANEPLLNFTLIILF